MWVFFFSFFNINYRSIRFLPVAIFIFSKPKFSPSSLVFDLKRGEHTASGSSEESREKGEKTWIFNVFHKYLHDCDIQKPTKTKYESHEKFLFLCKHYYLFNNLTPFCAFLPLRSENIDYSPWGVVRVHSTYFYFLQPPEKRNSRLKPYVLFY